MDKQEFHKKGKKTGLKRGITLEPPHI